jgi:signal transduction histidine kinase
MGRGPFAFAGAAALATLGYGLWTLGIYHYQVGRLLVLETGVPGPPWTLRYLVDTALDMLRQQLAPLLGLLLMTQTAAFRRVVRERAEPGDEWRLLALFALAQAGLIGSQLLWPEGDFPTLGLLLPLMAGLIGGVRLGVLVGLLNAASLAGLAMLGLPVADGHLVPYGRELLTSTPLLGGLWLGAVSGLVGVRMGPRRFHPLVGVGLALLGEGFIAGATLLSTWAPPFEFQRYSRNLFAAPLMAALSCWAAVWTVRASRQLGYTQAELALRQAELRALRSQINPHFLRNSLSVIHHLIRSEPEKARDLLLDLSDLFDHSLRAGEFVTLRQELGHVRAYLALEQARMGERLKVEILVLGDELLDALLPTLTVQPLVENAVQHGLAPKKGGGTLLILARQVGADLELQIVDDGLGFSPAALNTGAERPSIGLSNVDHRLKLHYGPRSGVGLVSSPGAGTTATLRLPLPAAMPSSAAQATLLPGEELSLPGGKP